MKQKKECMKDTLDKKNIIIEKAEYFGGGMNE